jgi:HlyD family secretion protein
MLKSRWIWVVLGIVAIGAGGYWWHLRKARADAEVHYDTVTVDQGRILAKVTATGTLSAIVTVQVGTQVSGTIAALHADFNSTVTKGELIAKIEPSLFDATAQQARANLVAAEGNLAKAKAQAVDADRQAQRSGTLLGRHLIAQADYDTAQATADADRAGVAAAVGTVEQAKAQLHQAEVNLAYTDIRSPTNGTVIARNVDVGQTVAASLQAPTLFLIAEDLRKMQVDTSVAEADIGKIASGMPATFSVDAYPTEHFNGSVRQVRNSPQTVQNVVTYDAVLDVDNAQLKLKPGMTANCTFVYAQRDEALRVPNAALRFVPPPELLARLHLGGRDGRTGRHRREGGAPGAGGAAGDGSGFRRRGGGEGGDGAGGSASGGDRDRAPREEANAGAEPATGGSGFRRGGTRPPDRRVVWVLRNGQPHPVPVKIGISDGSLTEVTSGELKAGDIVLTGATVGGGTATPATPARGQGAAGANNFPRRLM